ncbi:MAG: BlaI/MecI/CopY family transcriptional regulator [Bacteroidales bacterium]|jgi:predicted transcriptional regulator|nr:BlaI/MecI/CopY family transcriptional regulator [Bacteroidales bacterium]MDY0085169.1 BlaI/MecI/CopY family transcriptional regulator [Bacteroidales bacterium]
MKELTKAEEQIMHELWRLEKAFVNDILEQLPEPRPAYNTVSTIVRILERKGFVGHEAFGKSHQYFPVVTKKEYSQHLVKNLAGNYFSNSVKQMFSFFSREKKLSLSELEELKQLIEKEIEQKSTNQ